MAFLRHSDQCLIPSPNTAFCFTNLSHLVLVIFRFFEKHAQNLNTPQNNSASWALQIGFNLAFKGLKDLLKWGWQTVLSATCPWGSGSIKI